VLEFRFVIAQLLATDGDTKAAIAELRAVRPLLVAAYGEGFTQVSNLDKQARLLNAGGMLRPRLLRCPRRGCAR